MHAQSIYLSSKGFNWFTAKLISNKISYLLQMHSSGYQFHASVVAGVAGAGAAFFGALAAFLGAAFLAGLAFFTALAFGAFTFGAFNFGAFVFATFFSAFDAFFGAAFANIKLKLDREYVKKKKLLKYFFEIFSGR